MLAEMKTYMRTLQRKQQQKVATMIFKNKLFVFFF